MKNVFRIVRVVSFAILKLLGWVAGILALAVGTSVINTTVGLLASKCGFMIEHKTLFESLHLTGAIIILGLFVIGGLIYLIRHEWNKSN